MSLWSWIQGHETLAVGIIGFAGVISTLWITAWQAREQRREERRHERQTLRAALIEELKIIRDSLALNVEIIKDDVSELSKTGGYLYPTDPMDDVYRSFTDRIGLLTQLEVRKVIFAYLSRRAYIANLLLIGVPHETGGQHIDVPKKNSSALAGMQKNLVVSIDEAIAVMERARDAD